MAKVSVLLCVHNIEGRSVRGLESVLAQAFDDFEVVAVDDGSSDASLALLQSYAGKDGRVRVVRAPCRLGLGGALNLAVGQARADILMRMDIDDWIPSSRMARQYDFLMEHPEVGVVSCAFERVRQDGEPIDVVTLPLEHAEIARKLSLASIGLCHAGSMIRKACFYKHGFYNPHFKRFQDYELWLRWRPDVTFANLPDVLFRNYCADSYTWERARALDYWQMYRYDFLARYLNFPLSRNKLRDFLGFFLIQFYYLAYKPLRWVLRVLREQGARSRRGEERKSPAAPPPPVRAGSLF